MCCCIFYMVLLVGCDIRCVPSACEILSHHWLVHDPPKAVNSPYLLCLSSEKPSENYWTEIGSITVKSWWLLLKQIMSQGARPTKVLARFGCCLHKTGAMYTSAPGWFIRIRRLYSAVSLSSVCSTFERELGDGFLSSTTWILHNVAQLLCDAWRVKSRAKMNFETKRKGFCPWCQHLSQWSLQM